MNSERWPTSISPCYLFKVNIIKLIEFARQALCIAVDELSVKNINHTTKAEVVTLIS